MQALHPNQQKIMNYLLDHKEGATLEELAAHLGITKTAAKEHLIKIQSYGYLTFQDTKGGVGRPKRSYLLTLDGQEAFPKQYSWLSNILLEYLTEDMGPQEVTRIMRGLADKISKSIESKFKGAANTAELLKLVTSTMNELGYRSTLKQSDLRKGAILEATNCVYHSVAKTYPTLCNFDIRFLENATGGMQVELQECIAKGGQVCRFCIKRKEK